MPCNCQQTGQIGQRKVQPTPAAGTATKIAPAKPQAHPRFISVRYSGPTSTVATGPVSGRQYKFGRTGVVVQVDPRDKAAMSGVPHLRQI